jgi:hypothetical protein
MPDDSGNYRCFLLRLRRLDNAGRPVWRYSLESPGGESHVFSRLADLSDFLGTLVADDGAQTWGAMPPATASGRKGVTGQNEHEAETD